MTRILIVEPEKKERTLYCDFFTNNGWFVETANSGLSAYYQICRNQYDIILIASNLPDTNGVNILMEITDSKRDPLLCMIAKSKSMSLKKTCEKHKIHLLNKPFSEKNCLELLDKYKKSLHTK